MLSPDTIADVAQRLDRADAAREPLRHLSREVALTIADGYAVQREWLELKVARGGVLRGRKVGLTARAMQRANAIDEPDHGPLLDGMFLPCGGAVAAARFIAPRVEVELAFVLATPLAGPGVTREAALAATAYVTPAFEIIDARIEPTDRDTGAPRPVAETIADFASSAGVVLGEGRFAPSEVDPRWVGAILSKNGGIEDSGVAGFVLGHPAESVAWLANKLAADGLALAAGDVILSGSFTTPLPARTGDAFHADFGALGAISIAFT